MRLFIILIIIIIVYTHIKYNRTTNNKYSILQISDPTKMTLEDTLKQKSPTIITNVGNKWKDIMCLTPQYIKKYCYDYSINVKNSLDGNGCSNIRNINMKLGQYIDWLLGLEDGYKSSHIQYIENNRSFLNDYGIDKKLNQYTNLCHPLLSVLSNYSFSMGCKGTKIHLHYDKILRHLIYQIHGRIKVILISPRYTKYLYKSNHFKNGSVLSKVNFWNPDLKRYPLFNKAQYIEILLYPGQILYIPSYWWYAIENLDNSISISIKSENIFSTVEKIPDLLKGFLILNSRNKIK